METALTTTARSHRFDDLSEALWPPERPAVERDIRCRGCGQRNRVQVSVAVLTPERYRCGSCEQPLFFGKDEALRGLSPAAYQHSRDRRLLALLQSIPGAASGIRWALERVGDRSVHLLFMSDAVRCDGEQFPEIVALTAKACSRLGVPRTPTVYLGESPFMNASTTGVGDPVIVVRSALLDQMDDTEVLAILGHELGHLHSHHPLYQTVAHALLQAGASGSALVRVVGLPLQGALMRWSRAAELTADRAALLVSRDLEACMSMLFTLAAGNRPGTKERTRRRLAPFLRQCREVARYHTSHGLSGIMAGYLEMNRTHPHLAKRVVHLVEWVEHGSYLNILSGEYPRVGVSPPRLEGGS